MKKYKCMNIGNCDYANKPTEFEIAEGEELKCPECGSEMIIEVKKNPILMYIAIAVGALLVLGGGGFGIWKLLDKPKDFKISLDKKELILKPGERALLKASSEPKDMKLTYTWKSNDEKVATVNKGGEVRAIKKGETKIVLSTEENNMLKVLCSVKVKEPEGPQGGGGGGTQPEVYIQEINVSESALEMTVGETKQITLTAIPQPNDDKVLPEVSDESIISYDGSGTVKALKAGQATITFSAEKGNASTKIEVTVKKKNEPKPKPTGRYRGTLDLGYASYSGEIMNGKPDGAGVLTYKSRHEAGRNFNSGETVYAENGERVDGSWSNGYLTSGTLQKKDGNVIKIKY